MVTSLGGDGNGARYAREGVVGGYIGAVVEYLEARDSNRLGVCDILVRSRNRAHEGVRAASTRP